MKYYTEALVNEVKQKKRFSSFFFGDSRRTCYYQATHRENGTYLLWIEGRLRREAHGHSAWQNSAAPWRECSPH